MQLVNLDTAKVKQAAAASRTATVTMIVLGFRKRSAAVTNLASLRRKIVGMGETVAGKDYMDFWRALEGAGVGSIILGRKGKQTRFEWNYSLRDVANAAIGDRAAEIKRIVFKKPKLVSVQTEPKVTLPKAEVITHGLRIAPHREQKLVFNIPVRAGVAVEINLPADTSREELENIRKMLVIPSAS